MHLPLAVDGNFFSLWGALYVSLHRITTLKTTSCKPLKYLEERPNCAIFDTYRRICAKFDTNNGRIAPLLTLIGGLPNCATFDTYRRICAKFDTNNG